MAMHYTINDSQKSKIWTHKPTMHYAPPLTPKITRFEPKTIDLQWPPKVENTNPRPCTTRTPPLIDPKKDQIRTQNDELFGMKETFFQWISRLICAHAL
jgi:hypothetical protein